MLKVLKILFLSFYTLGTFCLPMGNFSILPDLPEMYSHCKTHEDKDMTPFDFVTDHLLNFDGIFDKHDNGDEQKPHTPLQTQNHSQITLFQFISPLTFKAAIFKNIEPKEIIYTSEDFLVSNYTSKVFHPPITA
ncbi:hypothetical protein AEQU1_00270 [Aequorivita sp. CIP111184]|nr:hypothetical protein AEQU1_00270 [Aequorivita sp. CIP111184]